MSYDHLAEAHEALLHLLFRLQRQLAALAPGLPGEAQRAEALRRSIAEVEAELAELRKQSRN